MAQAGSHAHQQQCSLLLVGTAAYQQQHQQCHQLHNTDHEHVQALLAASGTGPQAKTLHAPCDLQPPKLQEEICHLQALLVPLQCFVVSQNHK
jgi:hypothetical protein